MRRHKRYRTFILGLALASVLSSAGADDGATEDLFLNDLPQVLSATRLRQPLSETPAAVTVIDRHTIAASGAQSIPDVLRLVPGFQVAHDSGSWTAVTYHGFSDKYARRMQVLIDGRSVYTPAFGGIVWSDLPVILEEIDRIEVIRGPNGVTYGANSFAAVINIITREAGQDPGLFGKYTTGDYHTRKAMARFAHDDQSIGVRVAVSQNADEGISGGSFINGQRTSTINLRGEYRVTAHDALEAAIGHAHGPRGSGREQSLSDPAREREMVAHYQQLRWRRALDNDGELNLNLYHGYHRSNDRYDARFTVQPPLPIPPVLVVVHAVEDLLSERYNLELQHSTRLSENLRWVWGAEARRDYLGGEGWFNTRDTIKSDLYRVFGNAEWRAGDWVTNAGLNVEDNDITGRHVSPRLGVNYHLAPNHTLRAGASRAYRTPSTVEDRADTRLCGTILGTPLCVQEVTGSDSLKPERIDSVEVGYLGALREQGLTVDLKLYKERIRDVIAWYDDPSIPNSIGDGALTFRNDGFADTYGWETQVEWRPFDDTRINLAYAYARQHGRILDDVSPNSEFKTDRSTPVHTGSLMIAQKFFSAFEASAIAYRVSGMQWLDQGSDDDTGTIRNLDARLAWTFDYGGLHGALAVIGQNLLDEYFDYRKSIVIERRVLMQLELRLP